MFELAFLRYLEEVLHLQDENISDYFDPIDKCMQYYFNLLKQVGDQEILANILAKLIKSI